MKLKLILDGTPQNTFLVDSIAGEKVENVQSLDWSYGGNLWWNCVNVKLADIPIEISSVNAQISLFDKPNIADGEFASTVNQKISFECNKNIIKVFDENKIQMFALTDLTFEANPVECICKIKKYKI
jgi:hypothetical protein